MADSETELPAGRELDIAVAKAMCLKPCECWFSINSGPNGECENCGRCTRFYSADNYKDFDAVVAWLVANAPTLDQGGRTVRSAPYLVLRVDIRSSHANYEYLDVTWEPLVVAWWPEGKGATLPEAACRLLVSWAKVRAELGGRRS